VCGSAARTVAPGPAGPHSGIVGDQLKTDVDSYNDNQNKGEALQLVLDFTDDMAEYKALKAVHNAKPD
jgi:hypothetical protein